MRQHHYYMGLYCTLTGGFDSGHSGYQGHPQRRAACGGALAGCPQGRIHKASLELAKMAGVDMTNPDTIREAASYVGETVDEVVRISE